MKAIYSEPKTKAMSLNLNSAICSEPVQPVSEVIVPPTEGPAPMF